MKIFKSFTILCIRSYQIVRPFIDEVFRSVFGVVSKCKHTPTCSEYMIQQIERYGTIAGLKKGFSRIATCHPYSS